MEVGALQTALGSERPRPLQLGAAKSNVGHLEGGAGAEPREVFGEWDGDVWCLVNKDRNMEITIQWVFYLIFI